MVSRYLNAAQAQELALRGGAMEVSIDAAVPKLHRTGKLHALRNISRVGKITYRMLGFDGDGAVKKEVIARYLATEVEAQNGRDLAITPTNYKFKYKRTDEQNGRAAYVLQLTPKKKAVGLFQGELWLDAETFMPVRESGRFVKSPSVFLKRVDFIRLYEIQDGVAVPHEMVSLANTRLFGPVTLTIAYGSFERETQDDSIASAIADASGGQ